MKYKVDLNNLEKVNNFVNCMQSIPYETYLCSGRYVVDAKSIVGIFGLDLSKPIELVVDAYEVFYKYIYDLLADICICKKCGKNKCIVGNNRLIHADIASIQRNLEKLGYKTNIREDSIEIFW